MVLAIYGGLQRLGLPVGEVASLAEIHGPLMICGVFGTLISLERAVAIGAGWPYAAPTCFGLGAVAMVAGAAGAAGVLVVTGAAVFLCASAWIAMQQRALFTLVLALGAAMLLIGCALWLIGGAVPEIVGWWIGFLVLTIAAERLELSRVLPPSRFGQWQFLAAVALVVTGAGLGITGEIGGRLLGLGLGGVALWLVRYDVAMRTVRLAGHPRFMEAAMLAGYFWLAVTGATLLIGPAGPFIYDLTLHAVLIGFVLSMVFGHALIIFPAITGLRLAYWPPLYLPLGLLHLSVLLRVFGDLAEIAMPRLTSGPLTALALVAFAVLVAVGRRVRFRLN